MAKRDGSSQLYPVPPRFLLFLVVAIAATLGWHLWRGSPLPDAITVGFDIAAAIFLLSLAPLLENSPGQMRERARLNDANRVLVLVITLAVVVTVLVCITWSLPAAAAGDRLALAGLLATIGLAWLFSNAVYALHYAHLYYGGDADAPEEDRKGLGFPGKGEPDYADFLYFAVTLSMTFATSDVEVSARHMRRVVLGECMTGFVFNIGVIGLVINALSGLAGHPS
jgi:uncharacterized membrane protein